MRIAVLAPWTDPTGDFVKTFRGLLENEVDMTGIEIVALRNAMGSALDI